MKVRKFAKLALLLAMITISVFLLTQVCLARVLSIAPPRINLGSVKPGDTVERKKRVLIRFSKDIDVEKVRVTPVEEQSFYLRLEGSNSVNIRARYSCKEVFSNKEAGIIHVEVTIKVSEIKWEYRAGKYRGEIIITLSEGS